MALRYGLWPLSWRRKLMHWIVGDSDIFSVSSGRILSLMTWFCLIQVSHSSQILSSTEPVFLWPPLSCRHQSRPFSSSSGLHLRSSQTGDAALVDRGKPGWGRSAPVQFRLDGGLRALHRLTWCQLMEAATSTWHAPRKEIRTEMLPIKVFFHQFSYVDFWQITPD